jgi:hypothetical protein
LVNRPKNDLKEDAIEIRRDRVWELTSKGYSQRAIANKLQISHGTVGSLLIIIIILIILKLQQRQQQQQQLKRIMIIIMKNQKLMNLLLTKLFSFSFRDRIVIDLQRP